MESILTSVDWFTSKLFSQFVFSKKSTKQAITTGAYILEKNPIFTRDESLQKGCIVQQRKSEMQKVKEVTTRHISME